MKIDLFSADIKLVDADKPDSRSFRLLEFNDGLLSGYTGYDALGGEKMISGRIGADYLELLPDHTVLTMMDWQGMETGDKPILLLPRGDDTINWLGRPQLMQARFAEGLYKTVSSDLHFKALAQNKAYQHYMADQAGMGDLFPKTAIIPTSYSEGEDEIAEMGSRMDNDLILKPVSECGGTGLRLISADRSATAQVKRHFNLLSFSIWPGMRDPVCLLQERAAANEVRKESGTFDGTMRVVFSVHGGGDARECRVHDAYWKLPSHAMGTGKDLDDIVSFSPSNRERKARKKPKPKNSPMEDYKMMMESLGLEEYAPKDEREETSLERIYSEPVAQEIKEWLFPSFGGAMSRYFSHVAATDYEDSVISLVLKDNPALQGLGWMMASNYDYYPASKGQVTMQYPVDLRDAIAESSMVRSTDNYMHHRLKLALDKMHGTSIHCEGIGKNFIRPLEKAISKRRSADFIGSLFETVYKLSR